MRELVGALTRASNFHNYTTCSESHEFRESIYARANNSSLLASLNISTTEPCPVLIEAIMNHNSTAPLLPHHLPHSPNLKKLPPLRIRPTDLILNLLLPSPPVNPLQRGSETLSFPADARIPPLCIGTAASSSSPETGHRPSAQRRAVTSSSGTHSLLFS